MEASNQGTPSEADQQAAAAEQQRAAEEQRLADEQRAEAERAAQEGDAPPAAPEPSAADAPVSEEERNPAVEQSPAATDAQDAIIGDPGLRDEQQPAQGPGSQDVPLRTSPPPPEAQSGVPLPEDRQAGVEPGPSGPAVPPQEGETPDFDASEGQTTTPPMG